MTGRNNKEEINVHVKTDNPSSDPLKKYNNPIVVSFDSGLPQSCLSSSIQQNNDDDKDDDNARNSNNKPLFVCKKIDDGSKSKRKKKHKKSASTDSNIDDHNIRILGKDDTCTYQGDIISWNTAVNNKKNSSSSSTNTTKLPTTKLCIGIYDKELKKLNIYETYNNGQVFALKQSVPAYTSKRQQQAEEEKKLSYLEQRSLLFNSFGSSKKRKVLKSQSDNVVKEENVAGASDGMTMSSLIANQGSSISESNRLAIKQEQIKVQQEQENDADSDDDSSTDGNDGKKKKKKEKNKNNLLLGNTNAALTAALDENRRKFLPHYDAKAKEPHMVYNAQDIAGVDLWEYISNIVKNASRKANDVHDWKDVIKSYRGTGSIRWYPYVLETLRSIPFDNDDDDTFVLYQIKCLLLLNYMTTFYLKLVHAHKRSSIRCIDRSKNDNNNKEKKNGREEDEKEQAENVVYASGLDYITQTLFELPSTIISKRFLELFTTPNLGTGSNGDDENGGEYIKTKSNNDKCLLYILLVYMMAISGRKMKVSNISSIISTLKIELNDSIRLLRYAGCTITGKLSGTGSSTAIALKVPLTFPQPSTGGKRKR